MHKLPPEIVITISEFVAEPWTWESVLELVKMTHICRYWRTALISFPHLWSSVLVKNDRKEFAACLKRSQQVSLAVCLDMKYGNDRDYCKLHGCKCFRQESSTRVHERNMCSYHTAILPLLNNHHTERIRSLDIHLTIVDDSEGTMDHISRSALGDLKFCTLSLPSLESFSFSIYPEFEFEEDFNMHFPGDVFGWDTSPPTNLRHLVLHGCYGGPILFLQNLTSFELTADNDLYPMEINPRTFLPFISGNTSLVSLTLTHCNFPPRSKLSRVIPIELSRLKTLRLTNISESHSFPYLIEIPALKTLSSLHISTQRRDGSIGNFRIYARGDDGFQLSIDVPEFDDGEVAEEKLTSDWLGITRNADPRPSFVRLERGDINLHEEYGLDASPLPLFVNAKVLEISASFAELWDLNLWDNLKKIGPQLTTLRLDVEGICPTLAKWVKKFVRTRLKKGMPLRGLERMTFEGRGEEYEVKAKILWEQFRASLDIDRYLSTE